MAETILVACRVPWAVSPTTSGLTFTHNESDGCPAAVVVLGAGRLRDDGRTDHRRVEIRFRSCSSGRVGPKSDDHGIESIGYTVDRSFVFDPVHYLEQRARLWRDTGLCPDPGFYEARRSAWLETFPELHRRGLRHFVISGRGGFVEVIAQSFRWREWLWTSVEREAVPEQSFVVGEGGSE